MDTQSIIAELEAERDRLGQRYRSPSGQIFANLHDDDEGFVRIGNQLNVCDWIAVDEHQAGERSFLGSTRAAPICEKGGLLEDGEDSFLIRRRHRAFRIRALQAAVPR
jgi:hypothetical protein